jgi:hypothetical protein
MSWRGRREMVAGAIGGGDGNDRNPRRSILVHRAQLRPCGPSMKIDRIAIGFVLFLGGFGFAGQEIFPIRIDGRSGWLAIQSHQWKRSRQNRSCSKNTNAPPKLDRAFSSRWIFRLGEACVADS